MLKPNPQKAILFARLTQAIDDAYEREPAHVEEVDSPRISAIEEALAVAPTLIYEDKGGAHQKAAALLIRQADAQEGITTVDLKNSRAFAQAVEQNPAHALPVAYLLARKLLEEQETEAKTVNDRRTRAIATPKKSNASTEQILETVLLRARIRGHNDPFVEYKSGAHHPLLADAVAEQESAIKEWANKTLHEGNYPIYDSHGEVNIHFTIEALGRLCAKEVKVRGADKPNRLATSEETALSSSPAHITGEVNHRERALASKRLSHRNERG